MPVSTQHDRSDGSSTLKPNGLKRRPPVYTSDQKLSDTNTEEDSSSKSLSNSPATRSSTKHRAKLDAESMVTEETPPSDLLDKFPTTELFLREMMLAD